MTTETENELAVPPGTTHWDADESSGCLGRLVFCSGFNTRTSRECAPSHAGTVEIVRAPVRVVDPSIALEWQEFCTQVAAGWRAFVTSGYRASMRGVNNNREYRAPQSVLDRIRAARGGSINLAGVTYTVASSDTAGVSLHREIPEAHRPSPNVRSYIFHL